MSGGPASVSPLWVRDTMLEDYQKNARTIGVEPNSRALEALVQDDLRIADAVEREAKPARPKPPPPTSAISPRVQRMAQESGFTLFERGLDAPAPAIAKPAQDFQERRARRMAFLNRPPRTAKELAMITRLGKILAIRSKFRPSITTDYEIPALANRWAALMVNLEKGRGPFMGLSPRDCERLYWAEVWDICQKSTGKLGSFWVK